jgi:hypothetical protein
LPAELFQAHPVREVLDPFVVLLDLHHAQVLHPQCTHTARDQEKTTEDT